MSEAASNHISAELAFNYELRHSQERQDGEIEWTDYLNRRPYMDNSGNICNPSGNQFFINPDTFFNVHRQALEFAGNQTYESMTVPELVDRLGDASIHGDKTSGINIHEVLREKLQPEPDVYEDHSARVTDHTGENDTAPAEELEPTPQVAPQTHEVDQPEEEITPERENVYEVYEGDTALAAEDEPLIMDEDCIDVDETAEVVDGEMVDADAVEDILSKNHRHDEDEEEKLLGDANPDRNIFGDTSVWSRYSMRYGRRYFIRPTDIWAALGAKFTYLAYSGSRLYAKPENRKQRIAATVLAAVGVGAAVKYGLFSGHSSSHLHSIGTSHPVSPQSHIPNGSGLNVTVSRSSLHPHHLEHLSRGADHHMFHSKLDHAVKPAVNNIHNGLSVTSSRSSLAPNGVRHIHNNVGPSMKPTADRAPEYLAHEQVLRLSSQENSIWSNVQQALHHRGSKASNANVSKITDWIMRSRHLSLADTYHLPVGYTFHMPPEHIMNEILKQTAQVKD